ncbi:hypothetical protein GCM10010329_07210 [Streptomyces spiroverticillatus]|uniref:Uncharacterized protein n=1 Tax=Streptomyces finlayi TaxID=67296 RepID=A0A918WT97_9ACTN|nr:hypothetical protein GCM10010329_07210 [Streptomyces spiroverticillatus]GHC80261.1 hypothetical protein GCM10010334_07200 [Streptomyces finlayi]
MPRNENRSHTSRPDRVIRPFGWPKKAVSSPGGGWLEFRDPVATPDSGDSSD